MSELSFFVTGAHAERYTAAPQLALRVRVAETSGVPVYAMTLRAQMRIEPQQRRYEADESRAFELFGAPERYGDTLKSLLWTHVSQTVLAFEGETEFDLTIPCSYDFEVAAHKYLEGAARRRNPADRHVQRDACSCGARTAACRRSSCRGRARRAIGCPSRYGARRWTRTFPTAPGCASTARRSTSCTASRAAGGFPTWEAALARLCADAKSTP